MSQKEKADIVFNGVNLEVIFYYSKGYRGLREHGTGLQLEPDEDESVEIEEVLTNEVIITGLFEFSEELMEELKWLVWKYIQDDNQRRLECMAESLIETQKERSDF